MVPYSKLRKDVDKLFGSKDTLAVYIYLLVSCNFRPEYYEKGGFAVAKDCLVRSANRIGTDLSLSESSVRRSLRRLEKIGFIKTERNGRFNIINVIIPASPVSPVHSGGYADIEF